MDKARKAALSALDLIFSDDAYSNITLDKIFKNGDFSALDKGFISKLTYGVLERKITLDYILSKYLKKGTDKTNLTVLNALRMGLYQIMYMDKVPDSAAVNESVNLIKASKQKYSASLVNAVLRNVLRNGTELPDDDSIYSLSVNFSCSEYIVKELVTDYGKETAVEILKNSFEPSTVYLKVNTVKISEDELIDLLSKEEIKAKKCEISGAVFVEGNIDVSSSECYKKGLFHIEDIACQRAVDILAAKSGERILDMCSAPGGKAFSMAEDMNNHGEIIACDIYKHRTELIKKGAHRLGLDIIKPLLVDVGNYGDIGLFDAVLCDVPCSGFGVIGRKPEIKYKPENDYSELSDIQKGILSCADKYLKPNGRLMYSTCTLRKAENEKIVSAFLSEHTDYSLLYEHTFIPHIDNTDGFYCALLKKNG